MIARSIVAAAATALLLGCAPAAPDGAALDPSAQPAPRLDVSYEPTPQVVVEAMLDLAGVGPNDIVYDLGSGDGRIPITAARRHGARGVGIDIDPQRIAEARENARAAGVTRRVVFREGDLFAADIAEATVVTLFLSRSVNFRLQPKLLSELKPGTRVVSYWHQMADWRPERVVQTERAAIYLWTIPAPSAGTGQQRRS